MKFLEMFAEKLEEVTRFGLDLCKCPRDDSRNGGGRFGNLILQLVLSGQILVGSRTHPMIVFLV